MYLNTVNITSNTSLDALMRGLAVMGSIIFALLVSVVTTI